MLVPARYAALVADPVGRYAAGRSWLYAYFDDAFSAFVLWGTLHGDDLAPLVKHAPVPAARATTHHVALVDARRVEAVTTTAAEETSRFLIGHGAALDRALVRLAVVQRATLPAIVARGLIDVARVRFDVAAFDERSRALAWLGADRDRELATLDELFQRITQGDGIVGALRTVLAGDLATASLGSAARKLGISMRTLQRRLRESRTSFQRELDEVRLEAARRRLVASDVKLENIAHELGLASSNQLSALFRRVERCTPGEWRRRQQDRAVRSTDRATR